MLNLLLIIAGIAIVALLYNGLKVRELAVSSARAHCQQLQLQLLDQSVSLQSTRLVRDPHALALLQRDYRFEFTATGDERYKGKICMRNGRLHSIWLQPHRLPADDASNGTETLH